MLRRILIVSSILSVAASFSMASGCSSSSGNTGTGSSSGSSSGAEADSSGSSSGASGSSSGSEDASGSSSGSSSSSGSGGDGSTLVCPPTTPDSGAFATFNYTAPTKYQGACNAAARAGFITACIAAGSSQTTCDTWQTTNFGGADGSAGTACGACMANTADNGPLWISPDNKLFAPNYGACIQVTDPSAAGVKCGSDLNNLSGCETTYCDYCQLSGQTAANSQACNTAADGSQCATAKTAFQTDCGGDLGDAGVALTCFPGSGATQQQTDFEYIINLICGNADGG